MPKILAIDDKQDNLISIKALLKNLLPECEVLTAGSGEEGIAKARTELPDTILLDIIMPGMDGFEVCKTLKSDDQTKHIPIIMLTAIRTDKKSRIKGLELGADAFISKPIDETELVAQIKVALRIKEAEDLLRREKDSLERAVKERTAALKESEERFRILYDEAPLPYQSLDENGHIIEVNSTWLEVLGYSKEEVLGKNFSEFLDDDWVKHFKTNFPRFKAVGEVLGVEFIMKKKDDSKILVSFNGKIRKDDQGAFQQTHCIFHDITLQREVEEALRESENRLRLVLDATSDGVWDRNLKTGEVYRSPNAYSTLGYSAADLKPHFGAWENLVHPADRGRVTHAINEHVEGNTEDFLIDYRAKNSEGEWHWLRSRGKVVEWDEKGIPSRLIGTIEDINEYRKIAEEKKKLEIQLQQAHKMEAIGTLAGGIAHDFNNILSPIMIHSEMVLSDLSPEDPYYNNLNQIFMAAERARDLVRQILTFSRQTQQEKIPLKIGPIIKEFIKLIRSSLPTTIEIIQEIDVQSDTVLADPTQINQIVMNLCTNASYSMRETGGSLKISLSNEHLGFEASEKFHDITPGSYIKLRVSDTGTGMDKEILERIFEPYFTTKAVGEGTGMGLALVHGIIKGYGGDIFVESELGNGTTFTVLLPCLESVSHSPLKKKEDTPKGNERILFVDDEESAIKAMKTLFEKLGYKISVSNNSPEALDLFKKDPEGFDLLITDMTMPSMTGKDLAREITAIRPDLPIILCTGYSDQINEQSAMEMGINAFITKPITMSKIAKTVRDVLDKAKS